MNNHSKPKFETPNLTSENVAKIAELFPGVVAEGKVNFDLLRSMLGDDVFGDEAYEFTWVGKRAAIAEAGRPIRKTLRPCVEESKDWDTTENLYIEGDNLDVLKLLQEGYLGKVKMIYIDPPYNTGNDFIYNDKFSVNSSQWSEEIGEYDEETGDRLFHNTETNGRFHSDWCSMIYPRLVLARNLLQDNGVIFVSIDDNEQENLKKICDEVFGSSNFLAVIVWQKKYAATNDSKGFSTTHDYIVAYQKSSLFKRNLLPRTVEQNKPYKNDDGDGKGLWRSDNLLVKSFSQSGVYPIINPNTGEEFLPPEGSCWRASRETMKVWLEENRIFFGKDGNGAPQLKRYLNEVQQGKVPVTWWPFDEVGHNDAANKEVSALFESKAPFDTPKPVSLIKQMLIIATNPDGDIILDFFSGSATTAHAVMQLNAEEKSNRKYIIVQLDEDRELSPEAKNLGFKNICEIGKERIRRAGEKIKAEAGSTAQNLDIGFRVLKLDETNMTDVYYAAGDYTQDLVSAMEGNIKTDRSDLDLLYGCLLDWGLPLSMPHIHEKIDGFTVHTYNNGDLIACFEERVSEKAIREIARRKPLRAVFRDSSFASSPEKINVFEIFKMLAPNTSVKVI